MEHAGAGAVLRRVLSGQRRLVLLGSALLMAHQAFEALVPVVVGLVIDRAVATGDTGALARWIGSLAGLFVVLSLSYRLGARRLERAEQAATHDLVLSMTRRVLHPGGGAGANPGALVNVATSDSARAAAIVSSVAIAAGGMTAIAVAATGLLLISVPLGLLVLLGLPPVLAAVQLLVRPLEGRLHSQQEHAGIAAAVAGDLIGGLRVLKGLGAEAAAAERYRRASRGSLTAAVRASRLESGHNGLTVVVTGAFLAVVALVGGRFAAEGRISIGELIAAVGLAQFLIGPLIRLGYSATEFAAARASAQRVGAVLAAAPAVSGGRGALTVLARGDLRMVNVQDARLRGLSLHLLPGELIGVVAGDQAQAGELLGVLARETDRYDGSVLLDGTEIRAADLDDVRGRLLVAAHDAHLFEGTLRENVLAAGDPARLERALAASGADEIARSLPGGMETAVSERGRSLSGGQRQRVALARALATEASVLVLHDPTTAVDAATEARIAGGLRELRRGRSTVLVTSSPLLLAVTDRVLLISDGVVVTQGRHSDLMAADERYRDLVTG